MRGRDRRLVRGQDFVGAHRWRHGKRRARRGDVAEAILLLIAERPRNGYELMRDIENRSGGTWIPSPGSVYPALERLASARLIHARQLEGHRVFAITDEGMNHVAQRDSTLPAPWDATRQGATAEVSALVQVLEQIEGAISHLAEIGTPRQQERAAIELERVRKQLYRILGDDEGAGPDERAGAGGSP